MTPVPPILSIVIPTYNRAYILRRCLECLIELPVVHKHSIEILISDNASTDNTAEVALDYEEKLRDYARFAYSRNASNQGISRNIISLFQKATGAYIILLGDDDYIYSEYIPYIFKILSDDKRPSAIIQSRWVEGQRDSKAGFVSYNFAPKLFYEYGNAYAGIVDRKAALKVLADIEIIEEIQKIVWPQTVIGYIAIHQLKERPIYIADFQIGGSIQVGQNITNKSYWLTSLYGLLRASILIDKHVGKNWTKKHFVSVGTPGYLSHIKAIIYYGLIAENSDSSFVRKELQEHFGWPGYFWSFILFLLDRYPKLYCWIGILAYSLIEMKSPKHVFQKFVNAKSQYRNQLLESKKNNKRYGDWF